MTRITESSISRTSFIRIILLRVAAISRKRKGEGGGGGGGRESMVAEKTQKHLNIDRQRGINRVRVRSCKTRTWRLRKPALNRQFLQRFHTHNVYRRIRRGSSGRNAGRYNRRLSKSKVRDGRETALVAGINRVDHPRRRKKYINAVVEVYKYILCTGRIRQSDRHRFTGRSGGSFRVMRV